MSLREKNLEKENIPDSRAFIMNFGGSAAWGS
jgi:hypothetical protein